MRFQRGSSKTYGNPLFSQASQPPWVVRHPRWALAGLLVVVGGILYCLYGLPYWRLTTLTVQGTYTLPLNDLRDLTIQQMRGRWLLVFRQDTLFAFDTHAYERRLRERWIFSELKIDRDTPRTLSLTLTEEKPAFAFTQDSQIYGVDRKGVLSTTVTAVPKDVPTLTYDVTPQAQMLGAQVLASDDADFFLQWNVALAARNVPTLALTNIHLAAAPDQTAKLRVAGEWLIVTDRTQPVQEQITAFFTAYDQKLKGRTLEYVDVTVPARVYFK